MRCTLGQNWVSASQTCTGNPVTYPWGEALRTAKGFTFAGYNDWRLPNAKELQTIMEDRCYGPAINETVFRSETTEMYWSSSPDAYYRDNAWAVSSSYGGMGAYGKANSYYVRLVRSGKSFDDYGAMIQLPPNESIVLALEEPAAPSGCAWTASSQDDWILITGGATGNGPGSVGYQVLNNSGGSRTGAMTIAERNVTVLQDGSSGGGGQ
jgi:hypothetical protein